MRITGTVVLPAFGLPALPGTDLGTGAVVATPLLSGITADTGCTGQITCYNYFLLRYRDGIVPPRPRPSCSRAPRRTTARPGSAPSPPTSGQARSRTTRESGTPR